MTEGVLGEKGNREAFRLTKIGDLYNMSRRRQGSIRGAMSRTCDDKGNHEVVGDWPETLWIAPAMALVGCAGFDDTDKRGRVGLVWSTDGTFLRVLRPQVARRAL